MQGLGFRVWCCWLAGESESFEFWLWSRFRLGMTETLDCSIPLGFTVRVLFVWGPNRTIGYPRNGNLMYYMISCREPKKPCLFEDLYYIQTSQTVALKG